MSEKTNKVYGVSELTREVKALLERSYAQIWLHGEIAEFTAQSSTGHVYMTIKDEKSQIRAVFFHGARNCQGQGLAIGSEVEICGRLTVYEAGGNYQILVLNIRPVGMGDLRQKFEAMRERLRAEGLFDQERKRPIPAFPNCVGVVTSRDGAALQDFLKVLGRRHSGMRVRIFPTVVQGKEAAPRIANAINYVNRYSLCDVLVVTRGGGSLEDLWPFNEEVVARAIAASNIPVISAVGHERDFSICDFVADFRCATPSVAAEQVVEAKDRLLDRVSNAHQRLRSALLYKVSELHRRYDAAAGSPCLKRPEEILNNRRQHLDMLVQRLGGILPRRAEQSSHRLEVAVHRLRSSLPGILSQGRYRVENAKGRLSMSGGSITMRFHERLERASRVLSALGPRNVLSRGYSIMLNEAGHAVKCPGDVTDGEQVRALLYQGELKVVVDKE